MTTFTVARGRGGPLARVPLLVVTTGILSSAMLIPALHAWTLGEAREAFVFAYWGVLGLVLSAALGLALARGRRTPPARDHLVGMAGTYALLPILAAQPIAALRPDLALGDVYLEMVAAVTTTGGSLFDPLALSPTIHLWRAGVAWLGGLAVWIAAVAILAPLRLGGFELTWSKEAGQTARLATPTQTTTPAHRIARYARALAPVYAGLTLILGMVLAALGQPPTEAAIWAMSTVSTSGITGNGAAPVRLGEAVIFLFFAFAVTRQAFATDLHRDQFERLTSDRELRMAVSIVALTALALFLRHWIGALELRGAGDGFAAAARALWGAVFTLASFLTTTGFESVDWPTARSWSGLDTPAVLLVGLAMVGGGVATTAGGVKLLRVYALYAHGRKEMAVLVHPHQVGAHVPSATRLTGQGVEAAWVFLMIFAMSVAAVTLMLGATGLDFRTSLVLAVATLTTCGPLASIAIEGGTAVLEPSAKAILAAAMVVGRLETLALIALFNPAFWRR